MPNRSHDLLLMATSLAQMKNRARVITLFIEGINVIFPELGLSWVDDAVPEQQSQVEVCTRNEKFGFIVFADEAQPDEMARALIHNASQMLGVILENLHQEQLLLEQKQVLEALAEERAQMTEQLELRVAQRTADLEEANRSLHDSRLAALNMMEEAIEARRHAEETAASLQREIAERKRTEEALRESEARYRLIADNTSDSIWALSPDLHFTYLSPATEGLFGYTLREWETLDWRDFVHPDHMDTVISLFKSLRSGREEHSAAAAIRVHHKDGRAMWVEFTASPIRGLNGELTGIAGVTRDTTARKQAEDALREKTDELEKYFNCALDLLCIADTDGYFWRLNQEWEKALGYQLDELEGHRFLDFVHPDDLPATLQAIAELNMQKEVLSFTNRYRCKDGSYRWIEWRSFPMGKHIYAAARDITERKQTEEALRESETRYRALIESQIDLVSRYRPDCILTFVNDAYCQFYGKTREELIGHSYLEMVALEFREQARQETANMVKDPRSISGEYLNFTADGKACWLQWVIEAILDKNDQVVELQAVGRDVTLLKQTETALRESQYFLQKSQTVARIGSYYLDAWTGNWVSSPALDEIFGIDDHFPKNVEGWIAVIHPDQKEEMLQYLSEHVLAKHHRFDKEYRILRYHDQQERWVHGLGELEFDEHGNTIRMIGTIQDITERKQVEESLHDSENRFSVVFNESADLQAISSVEPDGTFRFVAFNNRYLDAVKLNFGVSEADLIGKTLHELLQDIFGFGETVRKYTVNYYNHVVTSGEIVRFEEKLDAPLGSVYTESILVPIFGSSNTCRYILYSARDITERKHTEEALQASEQRFKSLAEASFEGIALTEDNVIVDINDQLAVMLGYERSALVGKRIVDVVVPQTPGAIGAIMLPNWPGPYEYRALRQDGIALPVEIRARATDIENQQARVVAISDISDRLRAEKTLRESEERYRTLFENSPVPLWEENLSAVKAYINRLRADGVTTFEGYFEKHPDAARACAQLAQFINVNQTAVDHFGAQDKTALLADNEAIAASAKELEALANGATSFTNEDVTHLTIAGEPRHSIVKVVIVPGYEDSWERVLVSVMDITTRKQAEEKIRQINTELEQRVSERTAQWEAVNKELESFAYSVSHDLRAPLRSIDGFSKALLEDYQDKLDSKGQDYLQRVCAASQRMGHLIDGLLKLSRVTRQEMKRETVNLSNLAHEIVAELSQIDPGRQVEVTIAEDLYARGDRILLRVALYNLLNNAWKFTHKQPNATITFGLTKREARQVFFIQDNGAGFDMTYAGKLFGAFQRLHALTEFEGTGIGLATVQRIINRHNGNIWAEGQINQGATFYFTLPGSE